MMRTAKDRFFVAALVLLTAAYAIAEEVTLTTYYPSPRGVYRELQVFEADGVNPVGLRHVAQAVPGVGHETGMQFFTFETPPGNRAFEAGERGWWITGRGNDWPAPETNDLMFWRWDGDATPWLNSMTLDGPTGSVGVGTSAPAARLEVANPATLISGDPLGTNMAFRVIGTDAAGTHTPDHGATWIQYGPTVSPWLVISDLDDAPRIQFQQTGAGTEAAPQFASWIGMSQGSSSNLSIMGGNVGIGTQAPDHELVVGAAGGGRHLVINDCPDARWGLATGTFNLAFQSDLDGSGDCVGGGAWATKLLLTGGGNMAIGAGYTAAAAPNGAVTGNVDANDVWLRGPGRWASQETGVDTGAFSTMWWWNGGGTVVENPGHPAKALTRFAWVRCLLDDTAVMRVNGTPGGGTCHYVYWTDPEPDDGNTSTYRLFAACPDGWKVISGGGSSFPVNNSRRPRVVKATEPSTIGEFDAVSSGAIVWGTNPVRPAATEGWLMHFINTSGFDSFRVYALCGD